MRVRILLVLLAALVVAGCATGGSASRDRDLITSAELRDAEVSSQSMYQAIQRLRPVWLRPRGSNLAGELFLPMVFVSGARYGDLQSLRNLRASDVRRARFMNSGDATTRYGTGYPGGIILVTMR